MTQKERESYVDPSQASQAQTSFGGEAYSKLPLHMEQAWPVEASLFNIVICISNSSLSLIIFQREGRGWRVKRERERERV